MIKSVTELGKYKIGERPWIILDSIGELRWIPENDEEWLYKEHLIVALKRGKLKAKYVPRIPYPDFIVEFLNWNPRILKVTIQAIWRSPHSGAYYYTYKVDDKAEKYVTHEHALFDTCQAAQLELDKIFKRLKAVLQ